MGLCWGHLNGSERAVILAERRRGRVQGAQGGEGCYCPQRGQCAYDRRRCRPRRKLKPGGALWRLVCRQLLQFRRSPAQIAATLARMHPDDPAYRVSHETIYAAIYAQPRGGLKAALVEALRQGKHRRGVGRRTGAWTWPATPSWPGA